MGMNSDSGQFVPLDQAAAWMERVSVGEVVKIKGEELEITRITPDEITLKLLSVKERETNMLKSQLESLFEENAAAESKRHLDGVLKHQ